MMFRICVVVVAAVLSVNAIASDVTGFSVRGAKPGMTGTEACGMAASEYPDEQGMRKKMRIHPSDPDWLIRTNGSLNAGQEYKNGCRAGYQIYDRSGDNGGAMTKLDSIDIATENGVVYHIKNTQTLAVGENLSDCQKQRDSLVSTIVGQHGKPTYQHNNEYKRDSRRLIWDYSTNPEARVGNPKREVYEFHAQCEMYKHGPVFAQMKLVIEVHSGKALTNARQSVKTDHAFKPSI